MCLPHKRTAGSTPTPQYQAHPEYLRAERLDIKHKINKGTGLIPSGIFPPHI